MKPIEVKDNTYSVVQKKVLSLYIFVFISKLCFTIFFSYFSGGADSRPEKIFDTNMDPTGRYTTYKRIKIINKYFAAKSVLLT